MKTFRIYNFGCKVNQEEGSAIAALFRSAGWRELQAGGADLMIINTCTVTQVADKKARNLIRRFGREYPQAIIAVCGCYAQRAADEIMALGGVHVVAGVDNRQMLPQLVESYLKTRVNLMAVDDIAQSHAFKQIAMDSSQQRSRAYLKIEDGCDQFCHYCVIAHVRGPVRSLDPEIALTQAYQLVDQGHEEIVLSGIHIGAYGSDFGGEQALPRLIHKICSIPGLQRLRLGSIEPQQFTPALKQVLAEEKKVCRHLHIPLQSGCSRTLLEMGRRYDTVFYAQLLYELRQLGGDIAFTSDVMVGYPGETEADFLESLTFCQSCGFAGLHVFPYSRREGTPAAARTDQIHHAVKVERAARMSQVSRDSAQAYAQRYVGRQLDFLVEDELVVDGTPYVRGHSSNYLSLLLPIADAPSALCSVRALTWTEHGLLVEKL